MKYDNLIIWLYLFPLALSLRSYSRWRDNYDSLPYRVPFHFNWEGKADSAYKKSRWMIYFFPGMSFMGVGVIFLSFCVMPMRIDAFRGDLAFGGFLMACSMAFLFDRGSEGTLAYSLGKADSIKPFMQAPLVLVLASSLIVSIPAFFPHGPQFEKITIAADVDPRTLLPIGPSRAFSINASKVCAVSKWNRLGGRRTVVLRWTDPRGDTFYEFRFTKNDDKTHSVYRVYSCISPSQNRDRAIPGPWKARVSLDGKRMGEETFTLAAEEKSH